MGEPYNVVVVGGGTSGWMTAAYLSKALDRDVSLTVVESKSVGRIGVGEATFSTIRLFFEFLGLAETDWMPEVQATYKLAIKFVDWNAERRHFYHPFQRYENVRGHSHAEWWLKLLADEHPFDYSCFVVPRLCDAKRSPRFHDGRTFCDIFEAQSQLESARQARMLQHLQLQYPYAYHFDAQLMADYLSVYARRRGVTRVVDDVVEVRRRENGFVDAIVTREHGALHGDLFVDCTGFRGLLINQALGERFVSFAPSLLCDRAVALQIPSDAAVDGIEPYTTATALSSGWAWNIPLMSRIGTGYVYSSAFTTPEQAEEEFRQHLGPRANGCPPNHIKMRVGRNERSWVHNCVAIGLSSGFVEPLESTGIFFIQHGIEELANHFPRRTVDPQSIAAYNRAVARCIDGVREFLAMHYWASTRDDTPFWQATKRDIVVDGDALERRQCWEARLPTPRTINPHFHGFEAYSYSVMLLGLGRRPAAHLPVLDHMDDGPALASLQAMRRRADGLVRTLPSQYEYLKLRGAASGSAALV
jgi:tryptophan halogenase